MGVLRVGPFTQADGRISVPLGFEANFEWHEITVSVFDDLGNPGQSGMVTGSLAGEVLKHGADMPEDFTQILDLATDQRSWDPELSRADTFFFTPTGFNANYEYFITVNSWGDI